MDGSSNEMTFESNISFLLVTCFLPSMMPESHGQKMTIIRMTPLLSSSRKWKEFVFRHRTWKEMRREREKIVMALLLARTKNSNRRENV